MGGEGSGLHRLVREHCDAVVRIPVLGHIESLNVSVATGVILYEALRQRSAGTAKT
jgi:23S rRNA (guanosine2251-2'-O)-methyltransferase